MRKFLLLMCVIASVGVTVSCNVDELKEAIKESVNEEESIQPDAETVNEEESFQSDAIV